jgi:tetratricopeptide (TPR) repeat protein
MFLDTWLRWFFCRFPYGQQLERLTRSGDRSPLVRDEALYGVIAMVDEDRYDPAEAMADERLMAMSVTVAVLAEKMISAKRVDEALTLLDRAVETYPDDLRLLQLQGLALKRKGDAPGAMRQLEPLYKRYANDQEMAGIMAGAYKEMWRDSDDEQWLRKSHKAYANGWRQDRNSTYLGINTATTALLLGRMEDAQEAAAAVRDVLVKRQTSLAARNDDVLHDLTLWDRLTLIEANLLLRQRDEVLELFAAAKRDHPEAVGDLEVARRQLVTVAGQLDENALADALRAVALE